MYYCLNPISKHLFASFKRHAVLFSLSFVKTPGTFVIMYWINSINFDGNVNVEAKIRNWGFELCYFTYWNLIFTLLDIWDHGRHWNSFIHVCNPSNLYKLSLSTHNDIPAESAYANGERLSSVDSTLTFGPIVN